MVGKNENRGIGAMTKQDVFGIIVRTFGLYLVIWGLWNIVTLVVDTISMMAALFTEESLELLDKLYYLLAGAGAIFIGFFLLAKADAVVSWAYRHHRDPPSGLDQSL
jgi:hypothetical protein